MDLFTIAKGEAGLTNDEIAERLHISPHTVKRHIQNILEKTGFESRLELAMNAKSLGLVVSEAERRKGETTNLATVNRKAAFERRNP